MITTTLLLTITLLGSPQTVLAHGPDNPISTHGNLMYFPFNVTSAYDFQTGQLINPHVIGPGPSYDACGAWLLSEFEAGGIVKGFYHAEHECDYSVPETHKSIAYAESYDGGLTFQGLGQIIRTPDHITDTLYNDEGDGHVVRNGDYYYLYFLKRVDICVARSQSGLPGTWYKWHEGEWDEPGLGGESSPIAGINVTWVSWNERLGLWLGFHQRPDGWGLSVSEDGLNWSRIDRTLFVSSFQWLNRQDDPLPLIYYFSIIGLNGDDETGGGLFWIYYTEMPPYQGYEARSLRRQLVGVGDVTGVWLPVGRK